MKFKMSSAVAIQTKEPAKAMAFYSEVLGFPLRQEGTEDAVDAKPLIMFTDSNMRCEGLLMELVVDDLSAARSFLAESGCEILVWEGSGGSCVIRDPFGVHYNIWEERS